MLTITREALHALGSRRTERSLDWLTDEAWWEARQGLASNYDAEGKNGGHGYKSAPQYLE
jgi:hypothetical protein